MSERYGCEPSKPPATITYAELDDMVTIEKCKGEWLVMLCHIHVASRPNKGLADAHRMKLVDAMAYRLGVE